MISLFSRALFWGCFWVKRLTFLPRVLGVSASGQQFPSANAMCRKGLSSSAVWRSWQSLARLRHQSRLYPWMLTVVIANLQSFVGAEEESSCIAFKFQRGLA